VQRTNLPGQTQLLFLFLDEMLRVAFQITGDRQWVAGKNYLRNLFHAVRENATGKLDLCIVSSSKQDSSNQDVSSLGVDKVVRCEMPRRWSPSWALNGTLKRLVMTDKFAERQLEKNGVHVLFGRELKFKYARIATLSWLPDFQHHHFPEMFREEERRLRDEGFRQSIVAASRVILPCNAARDDFNAFLPEYTYKVRVTHPLSYIPETIYRLDPRTVVDQYHLPEKFIYLPNQFWIHKNHEAVFEALKILKDKGIKVTVVCTGYPGDYREATYIAALWEKVSQWNIRDQLMYLGLIPREHVLLLIRQCISVINPSLVEGWA